MSKEKAKVPAAATKSAKTQSRGTRLSRAERRKRAKAAIRRAKAKANSLRRAQRRAEAAKRIERERQTWYDEGYFHGKKDATDNATADLDLQRRKANIELARSLSQLVEATARAVVTFIGEAGIHP